LKPSAQPSSNVITNDFAGGRIRDARSCASVAAVIVANTTRLTTEKVVTGGTYLRNPYPDVLKYVGIALIVLRRHDREQPIPVGPYLVGGGLVAMLFGDSLMRLWWQSV